MSSLAKDLVRNILVVDPNMRPELADIKQHKYFRSVQWDLIAAKKEKPPFIPPIPTQREQSTESQMATLAGHSPILQKHKSSKVLGDYQMHKINKVFKDF
jgi:serine/threonine protein kinase